MYNFRETGLLYINNNKNTHLPKRILRLPTMRNSFISPFCQPLNEKWVGIYIYLFSSFYLWFSRHFLLVSTNSTSPALLAVIWGYRRRVNTQVYADALFGIGLPAICFRSGYVHDVIGLSHSSKLYGLSTVSPAGGRGGGGGGGLVLQSMGKPSFFTVFVKYFLVWQRENSETLVCWPR